jgi:organic hydroperoxide reductase OsmC/OhrA
LQDNETRWHPFIAKSDSAPNAIHFTAPKEFGGLEGRWTPEELLLAALAGCFTTTLRAIAGNVPFDFTDLQVEASGTIRKAASGYSFTEIVLRPTMKIAEFSDRERALDLLKRTERLCLVARALDTPLRFEPQLEVNPAEVSVWNKTRNSQATQLKTAAQNGGKKMATEFCQKCKQTHPGRPCDYDEKGECAETLDVDENPTSSGEAAEKRPIATKLPPGQGSRSR